MEAVKTLVVMIDKSAPNGKIVPVTLTLSGAGAVSGLASVSYVVTDEYGTSLSIPARTLSGNDRHYRFARSAKQINFR